MSSIIETPTASVIRATHRTVQDYIDECPVWLDGTPLPSAPMTAMQWRIWGLAAAGKFFVGFVTFTTGVVLPLVSLDFGISTTQSGVISAASLFGILVGALALGSLSDRFGRRSVFILEMILFTVFLVLLVFCSSFNSLIFCLFGLGLALGCDYPTAHLIISESIPSNRRGKLVLGAFAFQAIGALGGTAVGYLVLIYVRDLSAWRWMYASAIIPAMIVTAGRFYVVESANWLFARGATEQARLATKRLLARTPQYPQHIVLDPPCCAEGTNRILHHASFMEIFKRRHLRVTILASVPWFLQDLGTYGIGIFTPAILLAAMGSKAAPVQSLDDVIANDIFAAQGAAMITAQLIVGMLFAALLTDKVGRIALQIFGFFGCAIGLLLASLSVDFTGNAKITVIIAGFMLFNFMTNLGPNAQTYLLAGEVFPTMIRGQGAGFAAAFAKIGAVATAFLFPILLVAIGTRFLLYILIATSILGAAVTWFARVETTGANLDILATNHSESK